jgi:DNA-binding CsgD family transcriptional regulator
LAAESRTRAQSYARRAVELALEHSLYELAARAYSVLYTIAYDGDNPAMAIEMLERLSECARKGGSTQTRIFGLIAMYEIHVERADDDALQRLDDMLERAGTTIEGDAAVRGARRRALLPARALRAAWDGDFRHAYQQLELAASDADSSQHRALRLAQTALYAFAAGLHPQATAAYEEATATLPRAPAKSQQAISAEIFLALADLIRGRTTTAYRHLTRAERSLDPAMHRLRELTRAVRVLYRMALGNDDTTAFSDALARLLSVSYAGYGRLLAAIPRPQNTQAGYSSLTPAEREILVLLARGASTKHIALQTSRSPQTIDTHIRAICRKLNCSGRREAVALATNAGWVA